MKNNILLQLVVMVAVFFASYFALSKIDWITILHVDAVSKKTEEKFGDMIWEFYKATEKEIKSDRVVKPIDSILNRICDANNIDRKKVKLHVLKNNQVNAFALPNDHLVLYAGLVDEARNIDELAGVIGHELGHMQKRHVMKKMIKEIGISAIVSLTANGGGEVIKETASTLTSRAYDRRLEREADITSVDYMLNASIDPRPFADFLDRLADLESDIVDLTWVSTHPGSAERSEYITEYCQGKHIHKETVIAPETWRLLKESVKE